MAGAGALWWCGVMRAGNAVGKRVVREKKVRSLVFRVLSDVDVGEELVVGRQSVLVSPWSVGSLRGFGLQLSDVTREDVERVATYDGKKPLDRKQSQVVSDAWKRIRAAQLARSEGRRVSHKEHPVVVDALREQGKCASPAATSSARKLSRRTTSSVCITSLKSGHQQFAFVRTERVHAMGCSFSSRLKQINF